MIENNHAKNKANLLIVAFSIVVIAIVTVIGLILSRQYIVKQAESRIQAVLDEAEALHYYVQREMHPTMYLLKDQGRMPKEFYSPEILSSSFITRRVFHQYNLIRKSNNLPLVEYKMASKNPRNKINMADSLEARLIDLFNNDTTLKKYSGIVSLHHVKHLYYARPFLRVEPRCLKCHGKREDAPYDLSNYYQWNSGFDLKVGDITAVEIIKTPIVAEYNTVTIIGAIILATAILFIILVVLYARLSLKNKIINLQKNEIENNLNQIKRTQIQLIQSEKMASLGILTSGIAHEINNPLNFINGSYLGFESFFTKKAPQYKDDVKILLKGLRVGIERASEIVKGLSHLSRESDYSNEDCNLHSIIDNCLLITLDKYRNRIQIDKQYTKTDPIVKGNEGKLHKVFLNVLLNAIQSINNEGVITIRTRPDHNKIMVYIIDNGCGIKEENITRVLDPFFTTRDPGEGIGLGLSITYSIIKEHNGDIEFESEIGKGTTVKIILPKSK